MAIIWNQPQSDSHLPDHERVFVCECVYVVFVFMFVVVFRFARVCFYVIFLGLLSSFNFKYVWRSFYPLWVRLCVLVSRTKTATQNNNKNQQSGRKMSSMAFRNTKVNEHVNTSFLDFDWYEVPGRAKALATVRRRIAVVAVLATVARVWSVVARYFKGPLETQRETTLGLLATPMGKWAGTDEVFTGRVIGYQRG